MKQRIEELEKELDRIKSDISNEKKSGVIYGGAAPSVRISKLETEIAELKAQLDQEWEEGQWLINEDGDKLVRFKEYTENGNAFNSSEIYGSSLSHENWSTVCFRPATEDEVKEALVAEAKRRGLVAGKTIITPRSGVKTTPNDKIYKYYRKMDDMEDVLTLNGWLIYYEGNWAEPVEDTVTINGKTLSVESDQIKIDCGDTISKERFEHFWRLVNSYGLDVSRNGEDINEQIDKLAENMEIKTNSFTISGTLTMGEHGWTIE